MTSLSLDRLIMVEEDGWWHGDDDGVVVDGVVWLLSEGGSSTGAMGH